MKIFNIKHLAENVSINLSTFRKKLARKDYMKFKPDEIDKIEKYLLKCVEEFVSGLRNCK